MRRSRLRRPSPALVISGIALFISLGGTGYAAAQLHSGATSATSNGGHKAPAKPLTAKQVKKLIAAYLAAHHGLRGPAGPQGAAGATGLAGSQGGIGQTGPQGPGAQPIVYSERGEVASTPAATVGPWTVSLACANGPKTTVEFTGPGSIAYTVSIGSGEATTFNNNTAIGAGITAAVAGVNQQMEVHGFLVSGSTMEQFSLEVNVTGPLIIDCTLVGDAIPVS
jgi:hypothetical protein